MIPARQGLDWLLADERWWLWSVETQREAMRLLVALAPRLDAELLTRLEQAVLAGPPRSMFRDDIEPEHWVEIAEMEVWKRLAKMDQLGVVLGAEGRTKLDELTSRHSDWQLATSESDEFPIGSTDVRELTLVVPAPRRPRELVGWLKQNPGTDWQDDDWSRRCRDDIRAAACALCALAKDDAWPAVRWRQALHVWSEAPLIERSWRYMGPVLADAPGRQLQPVAHELARWLLSVAKTLPPDDRLFLRLCHTILEFDYPDDEEGDADNPMTTAINHPVGSVTEALLDWWIRRPPEDEQGLPDTLRPVFTALCDISVGTFRHGRVLLAWNVITLFHRDGEWTEQHLLPLFDWDRSQTEARVAWSGFLGSPRLYRPLMESLKRPFLDTACRYDMLDRTYRNSYAALLTSAALDRGETFTARELARATEALPEEGLKHSVEVLVGALESAGEKHAEFWCNRVLPYWRSIWPKQLDRKTPAVSECLSRLCVSAGNKFPAALKELSHWLQPPPYPGHLMDRLEESRICQTFPGDALEFLDLVMGEKPPFEDELRKCLKQILSADPQLEHDPRFQRLHDLSRRSP